MLITVAACIIIEQIAAIERFPLLSRVPGVAMNITLVALTPIFAWPLKQLWAWLGIAPLITIPLWRWIEPLGAAAYILQWLIAIALLDFLIYWRHRAEHKWFWPIHAVHHSPTELHAANDIGHPAQIWADIIFVGVPLSLVQFDQLSTPVFVSFVVSLLTYYIHSPIDAHFGRLRCILVDNRFHRIHHSVEERHFDKNFAICFSIWDRLFRTAYDPASDEWPQVGIAEAPAPRQIGEMMMMPIHIHRSTKEPRQATARW
jgi:sterol desaturase/sphingolipid hydroxylase (fatty acid hydroxylase superfamily)